MKPNHRRCRFVASRWADPRGQAMVEFMLVVVILMVLFASMLELMSLMHTYNTLADAAKEGVRYAIVHGSRNSCASGPSNTTAIDGPPAPAGSVPGYCQPDATSQYGVVRTYAQYSLHDITNLTVNVTYPDAATQNVPTNGAPNRVQVAVSYPYAPFFFSWPTVTVYAAAEGRIMN